MKSESTFLKPRLEVFFKYLVLQVILFLILGILLHVLLPGFFEQRYGLWLSFFLLPIGVAIGVTIGTRKYQFVISETVDQGKVKDRILKFFHEQGLMNKDENQNEIIFVSPKKYNQLFNNWFGTELVSVKLSNDKIMVDGPCRFVENLSYSIKDIPNHIEPLAEGTDYNL